MPNVRMKVFVSDEGVTGRSAPDWAPRFIKLRPEIECPVAVRCSGGGGPL